jgi:hypothetical protein
MELKHRANINMKDQDTTANLQYARENLQEALKLIVPDEKAAYLEAMNRAPDLVETESDPTIFLKYNFFNAWDAARHLTSYWNERKRVFGDRAFLPLTLLTEEGALSKEALHALNEGALRLLPNDSHGRAVVYADLNILRPLSTDVQIQMVFFLATFTMKNTFRNEGLVVLSASNTVFFNNDRKAVFEAIQKALPLKIHSLHLIYQMSTPSTSLASMALNLINKLVEKWKLQSSTKVYVHTWKNLRDCATKLKSFGVNASGLPSFLGGFWKTVNWNEIGEQPGFLSAHESNLINVFGADSQRSPPSKKRHSALEKILSKINSKGNDEMPSLELSSVESDFSRFWLEDNGPVESLHGTITVLTPTPRDVISGKGGSKTQHNAFFVSICRKLASEYEATNKRGMAGKRGLAVKIVKAVHANKGRFLKPSQNGSEWEELSDKDAARKVAHCMRDLVYKRKKEVKRLERKVHFSL